MKLEELRIKLRQFNFELISGLKTRSRFNLNPHLYVPLTDYSRKLYNLQFHEIGTDILDKTLNAQQQLYDNLFKRYSFNDQFKVTRGEIITVYLDTLTRICPPGADPEHRGKIITTDVSNILLLNERVNNGQFVAEIKYSDDASFRRFLENTVMTSPGFREKILEFITNEEVEKKAMDDVLKNAKFLDLREEPSRWFCRGIFTLTKDIEVNYILSKYARKE